MSLSSVGPVSHRCYALKMLFGVSSGVKVCCVAPRGQAVCLQSHRWQFDILEHEVAAEICKHYHATLYVYQISRCARWQQ